MTLAFEIPQQVILGGTMRGLAIGVFAVGIILIYRASGVINVALGELGALCAALFVRLTINYNWPFLPAFVLIGVAGLLIGCALELVLVRRLGKAPKVILMVATIGAAQILLFVQVVLPDVSSYDKFPVAFERQWELGRMIIRSEHVVAVIVLPLLVAGLAWFLNRSKHGVAVRAAADNPNAARLSGISTKRVSTLVWALAGGLAAVTTILSAPLASANVASTFQLGPAILLRTLVVAVIAGMASTRIALGAGVVLGIAEAVVFYNNPTDPGVIDFLLFVVVLVAVLVSSRNRALGMRERFSFAPRTRPIPATLSGNFFVRYHARIGAGIALLVAVALPLLVTSPSRQFLYSQILLMALIALSLTVLTGWAGQLSLGQFAFVGLGGVTMYATYMAGIDYVIAVLLGSLAAAVAAIVVGLPALRMRGLFLAVTTLALAVATPWILQRPIFGVDGASATAMPRPDLANISLDTEKSFYYVCLAALALAVVATARFRRSGLGRVTLAVRDNEFAASAMGLSPTRIKLSAFAMSGALAGLAGGLTVTLLQQFTTDRFDATQSLQVVAVAVIGGLASITGAFLGALLVIGLPTFFPDSEEVRVLTSGAGLLILLLYFPGGLVQILYNLRDTVIAALARRAAARPPEAPTRSKPVRRALPPPAPADAQIATLLRTSGVSVAFGSREVLQDVSIEVYRDEVVGLIGANGAGKTTLMNAIGGYLPSGGDVLLLERSVRGAPPFKRASLGLGRTFQDAALYGDLTVRETVQVAVETRARARWLPVVLSLPPARRVERAKQAHADEILDYLGLGPYAESFISELSTGTRRIVEFACLLASDAKVLCLDEPTAGVAQREAEAFGPLLLQVRQELNAAMLIIEHDMPLVMSVSDRIYCLEAGRVICSGAPEHVRNDPLVIASYLGTDVAAIERSDPRASSPDAAAARSSAS